MQKKETLFTKNEMFENLMAQFSENGLPKNSYIEAIIKIDALRPLIIEFNQYFKAYDEVNKTCHYSIIKELYFYAQTSSIDDICKKFGVSQSTLRRYRSKYVNVFIDIVESKYLMTEMTYS